jgi:hypothetical protein
MCTDAVFTIEQVAGKRRQHNLETHVYFADFERVFNKPNGKKNWEILIRSRFPQILLCNIKVYVKEQ